ncbi:MAG: DMT family transporter, partial [Bacteroidetes bacterium]|nr:DMT family transporter [Bacteroidota bacterium]
GILLLMGKGDLHAIIKFRFSAGDLWILLGAFFFAVYTVLVRKKPSRLSPLVFLCTVFSLGTLIMLPFFFIENHFSTPVTWDASLLLIIIYLGLGNSVIAYLCWNAAIARLGAARTALFGNLIPLFSSIEALALLREKITSVHLISAALVIAGLIMANFKTKSR